MSFTKHGAHTGHAYSKTGLSNDLYSTEKIKNGGTVDANRNYYYLKNQFGEQRWCSGESTCLSPKWPGFDSRSSVICHDMWVEFVVGSLLAPRGFSPGTPVFPSPQKPTF